MDSCYKCLYKKNSNDFFFFYYTKLQNKYFNKTNIFKCTVRCCRYLGTHSKKCIKSFVNHQVFCSMLHQNNASSFYSLSVYLPSFLYASQSIWLKWLIVAPFFCCTVNKPFRSILPLTNLPSGQLGSLPSTESRCLFQVINWPNLKPIKGCIFLLPAAPFSISLSNGGKVVLAGGPRSPAGEEFDPPLLSIIRTGFIGQSEIKNWNK